MKVHAFVFRFVDPELPVSIIGGGSMMLTSFKWDPLITMRVFGPGVPIK